jgi:pSer/pThr/pTyr-binding forkhead associated (FHA) protein
VYQVNQHSMQSPASTPTPYQFPPPVFEQPRISITALMRTGLPLQETTYLALGGGLGSFAWVDHLVIHGVDPGQIVSIGFEEQPYSHFKWLCENSQIPAEERLRSDSGSTPDNIWGWPGYAVREIWQDLKLGRLAHAAYLTWQIFTEPVLVEPFTPKARNVYASLEREAARIGWPRMWRFGRVRAIRQTSDGRYVVAYSQTNHRQKRAHKLIIAPYLHLAVGYPGFRFLPDLQAYREKTRDFEHVVNAYEGHNHVYKHLRRHDGTVLVRGRGIVASRILERLHECRSANSQIYILHLMRSPRPGGVRYQYARRLVEHHIDYQPYSFPKACFGGDLMFKLQQADDLQRAELIDLWGGTTTANRKVWRDIINTGLAEGWYKIQFGHVSQVERQNGRLVTVIQAHSAFQEDIRLQADFIIDATGLDADPEQTPLLKDLLHTYHLEKNGKNRLKVTDNFEVAGLRNKTGRVYASGVMTLGGPYAPVDSFIGLQYAAQQSLTDLVASGAPGVRPLPPLRSIRQWLRWARGVQP